MKKQLLLKKQPPKAAPLVGLLAFRARSQSQKPNQMDPYLQGGGLLGVLPCHLGAALLCKFMVVPNYTYLKLKMPGPGGVITVGTSFQRAYECEVKCCDCTATIVASKELAAIRKEVAEETPDHQW